MTRILALYLPQFHEIPENNRWWGKGFTEWNVVKKAKSYNKHSIQPRVPMCGYYDLSKKYEIQCQAAMAKEYGVDGFVIYSYYSNGQLLLHKPANIILDNPEIQMEYCFSWANHDWMRTWFSYNKEMLRRQEYARSKEMILEHFNYLAPFFNDSRYIKHNGKPVFFIYDYAAIPNIELYIKVWNEEAIKLGFNGIYFVQTLGGKGLTWNKELFEACFDFEPTYTTFSNMKIQHKINRVRRAIKKITKKDFVPNFFEYKKVTEKILNRNDREPDHLLGAFAEWDNTPRHGTNGTVFKGFSLELFEKQLRSQLEKSEKYSKPFIIVDAWNEWGEGAFLEPDETYKFGKLEAIKNIKNDYYKE